MKKFLLSAFTLILFINASAQFGCSCLPNGIALTSQAQVDSFQINYPGCTHIEGSLRIGSFMVSTTTDIKNLNGFNAITSVGGSLVLTNNDSLLNLDGLEQLTSIGGDFQTGVISPFWPHSCYGSENLESIHALGNLESLGGSLRIIGTGLTSLSGLENLNVIYGDLEIGSLRSDGGNPYLKNIGAIGNIASASGKVIIAQNDSLQSIGSLHDSLVIGSSLIVYGNHSLVNLNGLNHINSINGDLTINSNTLLENINDLNNITSINGSLSIGGPQQITDLSAFSNLHSIHNDFQIGSSNISSLTGMDNLDSIGGNIRIEGNPQLNNLLGLENITKVYGLLSIQYNSIMNLMGLDNLMTVDSSVRIYGSSLTHLTGLNSLEYIEGDLELCSNYALINLSGLQNLNVINGSLRIGVYSSPNATLTSLTGLENLVTIGGNLEIIQNHALTEISALENLTFLGGDLLIDQNDAMLSLSGLEGKTSIGGDLTIINNHMLSTCEVQSICDYLADPNGNVLIKGNATGCYSQQEVEEACMSVYIENESLSEDQVNVYPNPVSDHVNISGLTINSGNTLISIFSSNGALLEQKQYSKHKSGKQEIHINMTAYPAGMYFLQIHTGNEAVTKKIIKY